jgi:hypothetical protein
MAVETKATQSQINRVVELLDELDLDLFTVLSEVCEMYEQEAVLSWLPRDIITDVLNHLGEQKKAQRE